MDNFKRTISKYYFTSDTLAIRIPPYMSARSIMDLLASKYGLDNVINREYITLDEREPGKCYHSISNNKNIPFEISPWFLIIPDDDNYVEVEWVEDNYGGNAYLNSNGYRIIDLIDYIR